MLTIQPIPTNKALIHPIRQKSLISCSSRDSVCFGMKYTIGKLPDELRGINISKLNIESKNVLAVNDIGYLAEIIKYLSPKEHKIYAIKRVWSAEKAKQQNTNPVEQMKIEAEIYKKIGKIKNVPKFEYYSGNFTNSKNSLLNNYLVMSWMDGKAASDRGIFYDQNLVNPSNIKQIFRTLKQFDDVGIIHNDLWAGNILFSKNKVNIIDFNRSYFFNPKTQIGENNLQSFKTRFLNRYFSDIYHRTNQEKYMDLYKNCLDFEKNYYKSRRNFYVKNANQQGANYYQNLIEEINRQKKDPLILKEKAINTVFESDVYCAEIFAKYFELNSDEAAFHFKKALRVLEQNSEIIPQERKSLLLSNIQIAEKVKTIIDNPKIENKELAKDILKNLENSKIYEKKETEKPYYQLQKKFCEYLIERDKVKFSDDKLAELDRKNEELFKNRRLKSFFEAQI